MNTLKPLLICAVLAGIGYGVYVRINNGHDTPPPGVAEGWSSGPQVQLGDTTSAPGPAAWPGSSAGASAAPPFAPPPGAGSTPGAEAPQFQTSPPPHTMAADAGGPPPLGDPGSAPPQVGSAPPFDHQGQVPGDPAGIASPVGVPPAAMQHGSAPGHDPFAQPAGVADAAAPPDHDSAAHDPAAHDSNMPDRYRTADAAAPDRYQATETAPPAERYQATETALPDHAQMPAGAYPSTDPAGAPPIAPSPPGQPGAQPPADGSFADAMESIKRELEAGQVSAALQHLSSWYDDPRLAPAEHQQLNQMLDQIAGTVIYSTQHLLEPPYEVQPGERLEDIGQRYNVPWQLLAKINGIDDAQNLQPGERLKVVRGPFNAVISLEKRELTLTLADGSYAGRFPIGLGQEQPPREGVYAVSDKVVNPVYHGREKSLGAGDQTNPLGNRWIGLGSDMGIHGTDRQENIGRTDLPGSISLSPRDVEDVFDILATGSKVTIRR